MRQKSNLSSILKGMTKIYTLASSENPFNIRYVGKTDNSLGHRLSTHIYNARVTSKKTHSQKWINKSIRNGYSILIEEIEDIEDWIYAEIYWIAQFKAWGFNLTNVSNGGEGIRSKKTTIVKKEYRKTMLLTSDGRPALFIARQNNLPDSRFRDRIHANWSIDEACGLVPRSSRQPIIKTERTIHRLLTSDGKFGVDVAVINNISSALFHQRCIRNWSIDEACGMIERKKK